MIGLHIEELSLRDGMQQYNIPKTYTKQLKAFKLFCESSVNSIEFRMLQSIRDAQFLNECLDILFQRDLNKKITLLVLLTDETFKLLQLINFKNMVNIKVLLPISDDHYNCKIKVPKEKYYEKLKFAYRVLKEEFSSFQIILEDVTSVDINEGILKLEELLKRTAIKFDYIVLADTRGLMLPSEISEMVTRYIHSFPKQRFGIHCHNDLGVATANTIAAIEAGVTKIECCYLGIGERGGNASLEEVLLILDKKGYLSINVQEQLLILRKLITIYEIDVDYTKVLIGEGYTMHTSGIHQNAETKNPGLYSSITGLNYTMPINPLACKEVILNDYNDERFVEFYRELSKVIELPNEEIKKIYSLMKGQKWKN